MSAKIAQGLELIRAGVAELEGWCTRRAVPFSCSTLIAEETMDSEPSRPEASPSTVPRRTVRLSDYMRELANDQVHQRWVADIERQIKAGKFDTEPLDADGLREYLQRVRPS